MKRQTSNHDWAESPQLVALAAMERLRSGRPCLLRVGSKSMQPLLKIGHRVLLEPCTHSDLQKGDLVAFESNGDLVLHRVLMTDGNQVLEKGDNSPSATCIHQNSVVARASRVYEPRVIDLRSTRNIRLATLVAWLSAMENKFSQPRRSVNPLAVFRAVMRRAIRRAIVFLSRFHRAETQKR